MDFHKRPEGQNSIQKKRAHSIIKKAIAFILVLEETKKMETRKIKRQGSLKISTVGKNEMRTYREALRKEKFETNNLRN